jgi:hypothetical protein
MLLILIMGYPGKVSASQVARDLYRYKDMVCEWLKRYDKEGCRRIKNKKEK